MLPSHPDKSRPSTATPAPPPAPEKPDTWLQRHGVLLAAIALAVLALLSFAHGVRPQ